MPVRRPLDDLIRGQTSVRVLRALSLFPEKTFTGRELARIAGSPPSKVALELERLRAAGILTRQAIGQAYAWRVNREHALFRLLAPAFEAEHALPQAFFADLRRGVNDPRIARAILFGSFARGDEGPGSDVDVLVLAKGAADVDGVRARLDKLAARLKERYGATLSVIVHPESELPRLRKTALFANIRAEGRVIRGESL